LSQFRGSTLKLTIIALSNWLFCRINKISWLINPCVVYNKSLQFEIIISIKLFLHLLFFIFFIVRVFPCEFLWKVIYYFTDAYQFSSAWHKQISCITVLVLRWNITLGFAYSSLFRYLSDIPIILIKYQHIIICIDRPLYGCHIPF
jgi:hypothetical protein